MVGFRLVNLLADYAARNLLGEIDSEMAKIKNDISDENITEAIIKGFIRIEDQLRETALKSYRSNNGKAAYVGSCALVAIVLQDKIYVANLGDSQGMLIGELMSAL